MNPPTIKCPSCEVVNDVEPQGEFDYNEDCMTATRYQCRRCGHRFLKRCKRVTFNLSNVRVAFNLPKQAQWVLDIAAFDQSSTSKLLYLPFLTGSNDNKWVDPQS